MSLVRLPIVLRLKFWWNRLWIRKDEFHSSLDSDFRIMSALSSEGRREYGKDLARRRWIAHERDLERDDAKLQRMRIKFEKAAERYQGKAESEG